MLVQVTSTAGHATYTEEFSGTLAEFIASKWGNKETMANNGQTASVLAETAPIAPEVEPAPKKKKADAAK